MADFFLIRERAEDDEESRQSKGRSSSFVVVVRTTRVTHKDVSFARTREAGRARGCHSERRRRVASGPGRRTKRKKLEKSSLMARVGRRVGEPKTFFGSKNLLRAFGGAGSAPVAREPLGTSTHPGGEAIARACAGAWGRDPGRVAAHASATPTRGRVPLNASHGKILRASRPGGHAPGSSLCHLLRASPPRRWRSRRGPSSDPSRRFGG